LNVLLTRPEPGASATAARLREMGFAPLLAPCLTIEPRRSVLPERPAAIVITSFQAVPALPEAYRNIPAFCVGDATAGRLRAAGFSSVESASGDARDLFRLITARRIPGMHLLAVGERHGMALARQLRAAEISVVRRAVYAARPIRALPAPVQEALAGGNITAALFFSAETARVFTRMRPANTGTVSAYAISPAVAAALDGLPWAAIHVALAPTEADLLALLA
jgi:uroporphyrinogen-III synthase